METREDAVRAAQELLASCALDDDVHAYLCSALGEVLDSEEDEARDFLEPFLPTDSLAKMIELWSSFSTGRSRNEDARRDGRVDVHVVSTQSLRISSLCDAAEDTALRIDLATTRKPRASATRTKHQSKANQVRGKDKLDEKSWCEEDGSDQVVVQAGVLNARAVKVGHYVMINSRPCRVEKLMGTQKVWRGPETGCFKTHFVARCVFTGKKVEHLCLATADVHIASVQNLECTVMDIGSAGELALLTSTLAEKNDVDLPADTDDDRKLAERIKRDFEDGKTVVIRVMSSGGFQKVVEMIEHKCTQ